MKKFKAGLIAVFAVIMMLSLTGCVKPYNTPEFVDILPNESAFLVPLEGQTSDQAAFDSEKFLEDALVATKRIQIPKRWVQTGRFGYQGEYVPTMTVIKVDRTQETREWTDADQGIKARSKDGIGFTVGISATSGIANAPKFLFKTSGSKTLSQVMDSEVRNRIETKLIEQFAKYDMTYINANKGPIMETVATDATSYFVENRGIEISNMGYKGDIIYDDPKVQESMNAKFTALQEQDAEAIRRTTATNNSLAQIEVEKNNAAALLEEAKGIADANREIQKSLTAEVIQKQWIEKWDGKLPTVQAGQGSGTMIQIPSATK